jgi:hypothetical protein
VSGSSGTNQWQPKPWQARAIKAAVAITPIIVALITSVAVGRLLPRPSGWASAGWWLATGAASTLALMVTDRAVRRLLPLAQLLQLTLVFPDKAPSRFGVALRSGNTTKLEKDMHKALEHGLPTNLDAAAEMALSMVASLNSHDRGTRGHSERVRAYSEMVGEEMKLTEHQRDRLRWGAILHDIGKLTVPSEILNKPGKPTDEEWKVLAGHPAAGGRILEPLRDWLGEGFHCADNTTSGGMARAIR